MSPTERSAAHEEVSLLLPWLANGRLSGAERERAEEHIRACKKCSDEVLVQTRLYEALSAPERVTYAPGPSFRKLLERLDGAQSQGNSSTPAPRSESSVGRGRRSVFPRIASASLWRPPGLAWAASFIVMVGMTALIALGYRWSEPRYTTHTESTEAAHRGILHIAFDRTLTIGEVEELLRANGARVVEGSGTTGIFGVAPASGAGSGASPAASTNRQLFDLAARLRADPRVRWVEPIDSGDAIPAIPARPPSTDRGT